MLRRLISAFPRSSARSPRHVLLDFLVIFGLAAVLRAATYDMPLFERFSDYSRAHEARQLDELIVTLALASLAFIVFGLRRVQDQRHELRLRLAAEQHATASCSARP